MKNYITELLRRADEVEELPPLLPREPVAPPIAPVSKMVRTFNKSLAAHNAREEELTEELRVRFEERRQIRLIIEAIKNGLVILSDDVVLTDEERAIAQKGSVPNVYLD